MFSSTHSATPHIMGNYLRWAFIDKDSFYPGRLNEMGVYSRRVFNQVNTVYIYIIIPSCFIYHSYWGESHSFEYCREKLSDWISV